MFKLSIGLIVFACAISLSADAEWQQQVRAVKPSDTSAEAGLVLEYLGNRARQTLGAVRRARTREEADTARAELRGLLEHSLGHRRLPWPPDLRARVTGTVSREGYRIEKVVFESLPGTLVAAHLYIPAGLQGRRPGILFYNGHWFPDSKARPDFQAFCINMARLGFVVLNFDPFGQGERGMSPRDHRRAEGLLVGISQQGFALYETQCALEYLLTRKEVDPERIGMTGASGGGYNTWMTAALDDRIKAAVPVVGTSEFHEQMTARQPRDWDPADHCHYIPNLIRYANNHELVAMVAPRPLLIVAASEDPSFPVAGVREIARYGSSLYQSYGKAGHVAYFEDASAGHGYQQKKREAAYGWFLRWLTEKGDGRPYPEPATETLPWDSAELRCFPPGQNQPAGPAMMSAVQALARDLPPSPPRLRLEAVLGPLPPAQSFEPNIQPVRVQRLLVPTAAGFKVPAVLVRPEGKVKGVVIAVDDRGKEAVASDPIIAALLERGWAVCGVDPRGIGELATTKPTWVFAVTLLSGENFVWQQAHDISETARYLGTSGQFANRIALYARGSNAGLAATYTIAQQSQSRSFNLPWFLLRDGFVSYRQFLERPKSLPVSFRLHTTELDRRKPLDREIPAIYMPFDALRSFDLPQLLGASQARGLFMDPINGDWEPMPDGAARKLLPQSVEVLSNASPEQALSALGEMPGSK